MSSDFLKHTVFFIAKNYDTIKEKYEGLGGSRMIEIRAYEEKDENQWLRCRVVSFLDCSYYNDVLQEKEKYKNDTVSLVAEENGQVIGFIDIEIESQAGELCVAGEERGAVIWNLGVLPEYRREGVAVQLWNTAKEQLNKKGISYCEVWTQEDEPANHWYRSQGFVNQKEHNWLRCYARPSKKEWFLKEENIGEIYGVEEMIFEVKTERRTEVEPYCYRMDEVRLYTQKI